MQATPPSKQSSLQSQAQERCELLTSESPRTHDSRVSPLYCERLVSSPNTTTGGTEWFKDEQRPALWNLALTLLIFRLFLRFPDRFVLVSNGSATWRLVPEIPESSFSDLTSAHLLHSASLCAYSLVHHPSEAPILPGRCGRCRPSLVVVPVDCSEAHRTSSSSLNR